jgi:8-oxo-dGTP pyrophosphatase MutT (NUDIX family)
MTEPPCSGFIILDKDNRETILVCTERDNYSFPKGKRHKGEKSFDTALRETQEETGLTHEDFDIVDNVFFEEMSNRGNVATRYYVAILRNHKKDVSFDENELKKVVWVKYEDAFNLQNLKERRKDILKSAIDFLE